MAKGLTVAAVEKLKATGRRQEISDAFSPGLLLVIQPTGAKSWATRFRRPDGTPGKLVLGPLSDRDYDEAPAIGQPLTLVGARALCAEVNRQRARGIDVIGDRQAEKQKQREERRADAENTFALAAPDFIDEYRKDHKRWREIAKLLGLDYPKEGGDPVVVRDGLCDRWKSKAVSKVTSDDIYAVVNEARRKGVPGMAKQGDGVSDSRGRHLSDALQAFFKWLKDHRHISVNPTVGVYRPAPPRSRERVLNFEIDKGNADEVRWFWEACGQVHRVYGAMCKVLLLTGCRRDEIARMEWTELNDDISKFSLPGSRSKNKLPHDVHLTAAVREIIKGVPGVEGRKYVFSPKGKAPISGFSKLKKQLDTAMLAVANPKTDAKGKRIIGNQIKPWQLHDLRRTMDTAMNELDLADPHVVEACINHVSGHKRGSARPYNRARYAKQKIAAFEAWSDYVIGVVEGRESNVVPMRAAS